MNLGGSVHLEAFGGFGGMAAATRLEGVEEVEELFAGEVLEVVCAEFVAGDGGDVGGGEFPEPGAVVYRPDEGGGIGFGCVVGHGFESDDSAEGVAQRHIVFLGELAPGVYAVAMVCGEFVPPFVVAVGGVAHRHEVAVGFGGELAEAGELFC